MQYNENFLNFLAARSFHRAFTDRAIGQWIPIGHGRVVKILSDYRRRGEPDVNGNGVPATDPEYAALDIKHR